ncbi:hypothetical protein YC2023_109984 [Brassica napus]
MKICTVVIVLICGLARMVESFDRFAKVFAGSVYHSEIGLKSFEHPENNMKAMPMIDSEGVICGANFQVDACTKINAIPRRGTEANWALANTR